jgi:hypothetical protein
MLSRLNFFAVAFISVVFTGCFDENPVKTVSGKNDIAKPLTSSQTPNFSITSFDVAKTSISSSYLTGVAEINYTGSQALKYVEVFVTYKSSSGSVLYKDTTYLRNEIVVNFGGTSQTYSNAFVSQEHSKAYYMLIDELSFSPSAIATVEFSFTGDSFTPSNTVSQVSLSGAPYVSDNKLNQNFVNTGTEVVDMRSCIFIFQNSSGISYDFTYPDTYLKQGSEFLETDTIGADATGRLACSIPTAYFESQPLSIKKTLLSWRRVDVVAKRSITTIADPDARKRAMREAMDDLVRITR